jgi:hypothetical protein
MWEKGETEKPDGGLQTPTRERKGANEPSHFILVPKPHKTAHGGAGD